MFRDFSVASICFRLFLAVLCGAFIGAERLMRGRAAGIRTHIIVCLGSTLTAMVGVYCTEVLGYDTDPLRISAQVVSGVGFLGVGTILIRGRNEVTGLTTAAGLWTTATIGIALGHACYFMALLVAAITFAVILIISNVEELLKRNRHQYELYIELDDVKAVNLIRDYLKNEFAIEELDVTLPRSGIANHVGLETVLTPMKKSGREAVISKLQAVNHVVFVLESI